MADPGCATWQVRLFRELQYIAPGCYTDLLKVALCTFPVLGTRGSSLGQWSGAAGGAQARKRDLAARWIRVRVQCRFKGKVP